MKLSDPSERPLRLTQCVSPSPIRTSLARFVLLYPFVCLPAHPSYDP